jgi:hypothetical protein
MNSGNITIPCNPEPFPQVTDGAKKREQVSPALANPHWPVWAARELGHASPFSLVPEDWRWWLENFRGHAPSIGWPDHGARR